MLLEEYAFEKGNHGFQHHATHFLSAGHCKKSSMLKFLYLIHNKSSSHEALSVSVWVCESMLLHLLVL